MSMAELRDLSLYRVMRALPVSVVSRIGASLGPILGRRAHPAAAARAAAAMRLLRSDLAVDSDALEAAQARLWANMGRHYAEFCVLHRIVPAGRVTIDDPGTFDAIFADGRPVIVPFVHTGNWETIGIQIADRAPGRLCALAEPLPSNRVRAQIAAMQRGRVPGKVLTMDGSVWRRAVHHLKQPGGILYVAVDEYADGRVWAPSFGRALDARGNLGKLVRIAAYTGAIILPLYSERLAGATFRTHVLPSLEFPRKRKLSREEHLQYIGQLDALFGPAVLRLIEQWFALVEYRP
jgi:KDO2-lipid IV(A) lauroyltransferase